MPPVYCLILRKNGSICMIKSGLAILSLVLLPYTSSLAG